MKKSGAEARQRTPKSHPWRCLLKVFLWSIALFVFFSALLLLLALYTALPDKIGQAFLQRAVRRAGGTLVIHESRGSLVSGTDLSGVSLRVPHQFSLQASHIHLKLDPWFLPIGVISVSEVSVENPVLKIDRGEDAPKEATPNGFPPWLHLRAPGIRLKNGRVQVGRPPPDANGASLDLTGITVSVDLHIDGNMVSFRKVEASCLARSPLPDRVSAKGNLFIVVGGRAGCDLFLSSGLSKVRLRGKLSRKNRVQPSLTALLDFSPVSLREAAVGWTSAPDLFLTGTAELGWERDVVSWSGKVDERALGTIRSEGAVHTTDGRVEISGKAIIKGTSPSPFWRDSRAGDVRLSGEGSFHVVKATNAEPAWEVEAKLGPSSIWSIPLDSVVLHVEGAGPDGRALGDFSSPLVGRGNGSAIWSEAGERWSAKLSGTGVSLMDLLTRLGYSTDLPKPLKTPEGRWNVPSVELTSDASGFRLSAKLKHPSVGDADFELGPLEPGKPVRWLFRSSAIEPSLWGLGPEGRLAGEVTFEGPATDHGRMQLRIARSEWSSVTIDPFETQITFEAGGAIKVAPLNLKTSVGSVSGKADFATGVGWGASLTGSIDDLSALDRFLGTEGLGGSLKTEMTVRLSSAGPNIAGTATVKGGSYGNVSAGEIRLKGEWGGDSGKLGVTASWSGLSLGGTILGDGEDSLRGNSSVATARLDASLGDARRLYLKALVTPSEGGEKLDIQELSIALEKTRVFKQEGPAKITWDKKHVEWSGLSLRKSESTVELDGRIGFSSGDTLSSLSGRLRASRLPLALLPIPKTAGTVAGTIDADLKWGGTVNAPSLSGDAQLSDGLYRYANSDLTIAPITATMKARGDRLLLTRVTATTKEGGEASASGYLRFQGFLPVEFRLNASGKAFPFVVGRDMEGMADFSVAISGSPEKPVMNGEARILKGRIQLPELQQQQPLPPTIQFVNFPKGSPYSPSDNVVGGKPVIGTLRGSAKLTCRGNLWVSNQSLLAEVSGALTLRFTDEGPVAEGTLELLNGRYLFQNIKFEILDSRLYFRGTTNLLPYFDVNASYRASGADIAIHLTGPADRPELHLSSRPPMSEGDILSTLLFGRPSNDLNATENRTWSSAVSVLALQYQAAPLVKSVQDGLGLDSIEVGASPTGGTLVGFSKYLGDKTVLEYRQTFGTLPESRLNLRYRINRHLSLQTENTDTGKAGLDLLWENRY